VEWLEIPIPRKTGEEEEEEGSPEDKMWAKLILPESLDTKQNIKYPVLLYVYGGPGSQQATHGYDDLPFIREHNPEVILAFVDGRGSKGRGQRWLHQVYRRLGSLEVEDTITAGEYIKQLSYVDEDKMSIFGWSYGGYLTAMVLGKQTQNTFKCGISVAPVTDWTYYYSMYTERHMGLPTAEDNLQGYEDSRVSKYAHNFNKSSFLLVHGTADDNVHFQHSAQLVKALQEAQVNFRFMMYPDEDHNIPSRRHLYTMMTDFLTECWYDQ